MDEFVTAHHDVRKKEREKTADRSCLSTLIGSADTMTPNYDAIWDLIGQIDRISAALADLHEDDPDTSLRLHRAIELLTEAGNILGAGERASERAGRV